MSASWWRRLTGNNNNRWDSSDPDRAPPPLPLNPQSPSITSRAGTSSAIQSAHAALSERARESAALVPAPKKRVNDGSPERALVKGSAHRRMQSMQPGSVRDLSLMLEGSQSPSSSPTRSSTPPPSLSKDKAHELEIRGRHSEDSTPVPGPSLTPIVRPAARRPPLSILGENTPPQSSTMLALQNMSAQASRESESPLSNITNGSAATVKSPSTLENVSKQILSLTNIATSLQKEMSQLARRSKDNATDLLTLKEVTSTRDEDIRKGLRDLLGSVTDTSNRLSGRDQFAGLYLDNKPHNVSPATGKPFQLPRIPSPKSFAESIDRGSISTPSLGGTDGQASLIMLEKIIRDMGTKDGQESLIGRLTEISGKLAGMASASKIDELIRDIRSQPENAIVASHDASRDLEPEKDQPRSGPMTQRVERLLNGVDARRSSAPAVRGAGLLNEDLLNIIRSVKDSVAQGGGLTAEVKALVRELRGEVLGMGRELGKRLDQADPKAIDTHDTPNKDDMSRVIDEGLEQMKDQLNSILREHRRTSAASTASQKTLVDYQEIYNAMRAALRDNEASRGDMPDLSREDVIQAVREAWESYKPEIEAQQQGLEREEVLACLQEGLQDYTAGDEKHAGATRDEVFKAVVEGLKHFVPPQLDTTASLSRDEIIEAVRDCLEEFEFPVAASAIGNDMTRADMVHAVREGLDGFELPRGGAFVGSDHGDISVQLQEIMENIKFEFRAVSDEAKQNMAATGRDTEQVLDATKDGLENLRQAIEGYVDRASGAAGQEEFLDSMLKDLDDFKEDLRRLLEESADSSHIQLQTELQSLREIVNFSMVPSSPQSQASYKELLEALQTGVNSLRQEILRPRADTGEIIDAFNDGLNELRAGIDRINNKPADLTANDEILEALRSGLESLRVDMEAHRDGSSTEKAVAAVSGDDSEMHKAVVTADMLKQDDIKNLEVLISQLHIKVEAMRPESDNLQKEDLARVEEMLHNVRQGVEEMNSRDGSTASTKDRDAPANSDDLATREDVQAIETILRNTKATLDDLAEGEQAVRKEHLDELETLILETKEATASMSEKMDAISQKEDLAAMESVLTQVTVGLEEMKDRADKDSEDPEKISKADLDAVEVAVFDVKAALDGLCAADFANMSSKAEIENLETLIKASKEKLDAIADTSESAMEERQAEIVGVGERVSEVKTFLEEFQDSIKGKLEDGSTGLEATAKVLEGLSEKMNKNENISEDLKEMFESMKCGFEESKDVVAGAKLASDEKVQEATETIGAQIDDKITELIVKYDEFQATFDERNKAGEARNMETEAAMVGTKAIAEELKLLVDTLGSAVTDSLEKMEEASKTVFTKVEELVSRSDETHSDHKTEHEHTREQVQQAVSVVEGLHGQMNEYQPQILEAVKDVLLLVGQHFEHSKSSASDIQEKIYETKAPEQAMLPPPDKYDDSEVRAKLNHLAEQRYDDSEVRQMLDRLVDQKYDDTTVHDKLDRLVDHSKSAEQAYAQLETIDKVHASVVKTAAEISELLSNQTQRIENDHEDREKTLRDHEISIGQKSAQKDHLQASVLSLKDEEDRLRSSIMNLRTEQESLIRQKTRLTGDVSSLETAMRLRKEDLSEMEARAERLERRIVEGVMDHSRILLMSKGSKGGDSMNRKRVKKATFEGSESGKTHAGPRPAVDMALSTKRHLAPPAQNGSPRRIVSLGQINNNASSGNFKRSQSVRTPAGGGSKALRKRSWGGDLAKGFGDSDKENFGVSETVEELEEAEAPEPGERLAVVPHGGAGLDDEEDDGPSDTDTLRRTSMGTSADPLTESETGYSGYSGYSEYDETGSEWTESVVGGASSVGPVAREEGNEVVLHGQ